MQTQEAVKEAKSERAQVLAEVGRRLRAYRLLHGYTQDDIGAIIECSGTHVGNYESGRASIGVDEMVKLCALYELQIAALVSGPVPEVAREKVMHPRLKKVAGGALRQRRLRMRSPTRRRCSRRWRSCSASAERRTLRARVWVAASRAA